MQDLGLRWNGAMGIKGFKHKWRRLIKHLISENKNIMICS
jgi:hypothetical protein